MCARREDGVAEPFPPLVHGFRPPRDTPFMCVRVASWALDCHSLVAAGSVQLPNSGDALQLPLASVLEREPGASHEIADGAGHEHLAGVCRSGDTGTDAERDPGQFALVELALPDVDTCTEGEAEWM